MQHFGAVAVLSVQDHVAGDVSMDCGRRSVPLGASAVAASLLRIIECSRSDRRRPNATRLPIRTCSTGKPFDSLERDLLV